MNRQPLLGGAPAAVVILIVAALVLGCGDTTQSPTQPSGPSPATVPPPTPGPPSGGGVKWMTGSFRWTSIIASRPMCAALSSQVGGSWPLSVGVERDGRSVTLLLAEGPPPDLGDPFADPPERFVGTLDGETITALVENPIMAMACPEDAAPTAQTGGTLTAVMTNEMIKGTYREFYGTGEEEVTFAYAFEARLPGTTASRR